MDEGCNRAVREVFVNLYEKGLIYRGSRIINWCPVCKTALSDAEVEYEEQQSHLWHIRYPDADGGEGVTVATTRPETMGWMNDILFYIAKESVYRKYHHDKLTFSLCYAFSENYILPLSHARGEPLLLYGYGARREVLDLYQRRIAGDYGNVLSAEHKAGRPFCRGAIHGGRQVAAVDRRGGRRGGGNRRGGQLIKIGTDLDSGYGQFRIQRGEGERIAAAGARFHLACLRLVTQNNDILDVLKIRRGFHYNIAFIALHTACAFAHGADGYPFGEGHEPEEAGGADTA